MTDQSLTDLHRMSVVELNVTDHQDVQAFRGLFGALRLVAPTDDDHACAFAREASEPSRIYVEFTRTDDAGLIVLVHAFDTETTRLMPAKA